MLTPRILHALQHNYCNGNFVNNSLLCQLPVTNMKLYMKISLCVCVCVYLGQEEEVFICFIFDSYVMYLDIPYTYMLIILSGCSPQSWGHEAGSRKTKSSGQNASRP